MFGNLVSLSFVFIYMCLHLNSVIFNMLEICLNEFMRVLCCVVYVVSSIMSCYLLFYYKLLLIAFYFSILYVCCTIFGGLTYYLYWCWCRISHYHHHRYSTIYPPFMMLMMCMHGILRKLWLKSLVGAAARAQFFKWYMQYPAIVAWQDWDGGRRWTYELFEPILLRGAALASDAGRPVTIADPEPGLNRLCRRHEAC